MNPFISVPIALPGEPDRGYDDKVVEGKINPSNVIIYHEGYYWGVFVYLTNGQVFLLNCSIEEYEKLVKAHYKEMRAFRKIEIYPYLNINITLQGQPDSEEKQKEVVARIFPAHVFVQHVGYSWGSVLYFTAGHTLQTSLSLEQYENVTKQYWEKVARNVLLKPKLNLLQ